MKNEDSPRRPSVRFLPGPLAHNCPVLMKEIDATLSSTQGLSPENMAKVKKLRADGERFHKEGKHDDSMKVLIQAKAMLGA